MIKYGPDSSVSACLKYASVHTHASHKCGKCYREDEEDKVYRELGFTRDQDISEDQQTSLNERLTEATRNIPTTNWRPVPPPVYGRRPSQSRSVTRRTRSLLSREVKPEDVVGLEAWESVLVSDGLVTVYETTWGGWDSACTPGTGSLAEEVTEDAAAHGVEVECDLHEFDQDWSYSDESEEDEAGEWSEGDDLLVLAQQTPLPLDSEVDNMYNDHYSACETNQPQMATDAPMLVQDDTIPVNGTNATLETISSTHLTPEFGNNPQPAKSTIEGNNTTSASPPSRPTKTPGPSSQLTTDSKVHYWYRQTKSGLLEGKNEVGCWELVSAAWI